MKTVTFCGYRDMTMKEILNIKDKLYPEIEELIKNRAEIFLLGGYGSFDILCAKIVRELNISESALNTVAENIKVKPLMWLDL